MTVVFAILTIVVFVGAVCGIFKIGKKDGLCDYDNKED